MKKILTLLIIALFSFNPIISQNNSFCTPNHAWGWSGARVMEIFVKFFVCQNVFLPITHLFKTSWTPSPVATPPKSTMPRRSKGSKHGVRIFIFFGPDFFVGPDFFLSGPTFFIVILDV